MRQAEPGATDAPVLDLDVRLPLHGFTLAPVLRTHSPRIALFGASGSGKSLTLEVIAGLVRPRAGYVRLGGEALFEADTRVNLPPQQRRVGYVPQRFHLFPHMSVAANVAYALRSGRRERGRVAELLDVVGLAGVADRLPGQVSGGQQQRVAFARALAAEPRLLLLDEPFASLDDIVRSRLRRYLAELLRRIGTPTLLVSHNLVEATMLADTVAVMQGGRIVQVGSGDDVMLRPADTYVAELAGMTNRLHATVLDAHGGRMRVDWQGHVLLAPASGARPGEPVTLGIRPEHVLLPSLDAGAPAATREGTVDATIAGTLQEGLERRVTLHTVAGDNLEMMLSERIYHRYDLAVGRSIAVRLEPHHLWPLAEAETRRVGSDAASSGARVPPARRRSPDR